MQATDAVVSKSAAIRSRLDHPIIDSDGHVAEFEPALFDYLKNVGGAGLVERFKALDGPYAFRWYGLTPEQRRDQRAARPPWWVHPTRNTLDRAASSLPKLFHQRLDEMGLDYTIIYPSLGLILLHMGDDEIRRAGCRALNQLNAGIFRAYADRMTPVAVIPMHTPAEAIDELEYAVKELGMKTAMVASYVKRPIPALARMLPESGS
ncbi:MAG: hypothetical protein ACREH9_09965 [Pseudomonadota bacterium]